MQVKKRNKTNTMSFVKHNKITKKTLKPFNQVIVIMSAN